MLNMTGDECRNIRYKLKLSQRVFAKIVGIGISSVIKYETGKAVPEKTPRMIYELLKDDPKLVIKMWKINEHKLTDNERESYVYLYQRKWEQPTPRPNAPRFKAY